MKRILILLVSLGAMHVACGGNDTTGPGGGTTGTTTTTTTTGGGGGATNATPAFTVANTPCVAPSTGNVSCTFNATATGGTAPYKFDWLFTNPANNQEVRIDNSVSASPALGCSFSSGTVTFSITVRLTATPASGTAGTTTATQSVTRAAGACGT